MDDRHAWEQPGAFEVAPGVFRIPLPLPGDHLKAVNVYAIVDGERLVLVDGGWALAEAEQQLTQSLDKIGFGLDGIREFLVTHIHRDHYTQAIAVRRTYGSTVALGDGERASMEAMHAEAPGNSGVTGLQRAGATDLARQLAEWPRDYDLTNWDFPDRWLADGAELTLQSRSLRVIATPGHTRGHVVFHDTEHGVLFAGDHVLPHITPSIGLEAARPESPLRDYMASLQLILTMPDAALLPAHGPVTDSAHARAEALLDHHERRLTEIATVVERGASSAFEVACLLGWTRHQRHIDELDLFNQIMAVQETMAHLQVLVERGWLRADDVDAVTRFARA